MNRRFVIVLALLALLVVPVIVAQLSSAQERTFQSVKLQSVQYEEIMFQNTEQDLELAGMLLLPEGEGPFPAAVIIHGSGSSFRDNIWYLTLAKYLQDHGVAVLLPDKRGSEKSEGDWRTASMPDLATDTVAAVQYLQNQREAQFSTIGIIGMSQGGMIAPVAASRTDAIEYVVNVVGGAVPMHQALVYEEKHNLRQMGLLPGFSDVLAYPAAWSLIYLRQADFWDAVGNFDPLPYWQRLQVEALVLYGSEDTNVPSRRSARRLRSLDRPTIDVVIYPGSGHALESPEGEGNQIFRTEALEDILAFIHGADSSR